MTRNLSQYFAGVGLKRLSAVEALRVRSHQHEFNGIDSFRRVFGDYRRRMQATFIRLFDDEDNFEATGTLTWYDAREASPRRTEYRLYYATTEGFSFSEGDVVAVCLKNDGSILLLAAAAETTSERQLLWLFGKPDLPAGNSSAQYEIESPDLDISRRLILERAGLQSFDSADSYRDELVRRFGKAFPTTLEFSAFARQTFPGDAIQSPDETLCAWIEHEEGLFRALEKTILEAKLGQGFSDVDEFLSFSLSVQNRRKSRAGLALEHHTEEILRVHGISHSRGAITENRAVPDFIFPGIEAYRNPMFPGEGLSMLAVKSTCKDRWRQVLSEANRIQCKHLLTLEPSISQPQTTEMRSHKLTLVIPRPIQVTYAPSQTEVLLTLREFLDIVKARQRPD